MIQRLRDEQRIVIRRPATEVWAFVTDLPRTSSWRTTVQEVAWTGAEPPGVGRRLRAVTRVFGRRWTWVLETTAWEPPRRFGYRVVQGQFDLDVEYRCEPADEGCLFTLAGGARTPAGPLGRLLAPLAGRSMAGQARAALQRLKAILEAGPPA